MNVATEANHSGEDLPAYVNGTLDTERRERLEAHIAACAVCQDEVQEWQAIARGVQESVAAGSAPRGLMDRVWLEVDGAEIAHSGSSARLRRWLRQHLPRPPQAPSRRLAAGIAAVACLLVAAFAGARADNLFQVFAPQQFATIPVSAADLQSLPDLSRYGTFTAGTPATTAAATVDTPEQASAAAGFTVRVPSSLPADVPASSRYAVVPGNSETFTLSAAKAQAAAAAEGKQAPPMPAGLDGASLQLVSNTAVVAMYGSSPDTAAAQPAGAEPLNAMPVLVIGQTAAPKVVATGASAADIEHYLLSLPGISPQLAAAVRALGTPGSIWPVPVPAGAAASHPVQVQGVKGVAIGDSTGLGAAVLWQKDGMVYAVAGTLSQPELLSIANSLH